MTPEEIQELEDDGYRVILEPRVYASISKLADMTGVDRRTISSRLKAAGLNHHGERNARLYATDAALPIICQRPKRRQ